jgi:hypothetical protein
MQLCLRQLSQQQSIFLNFGHYLIASPDHTDGPFLIFSLRIFCFVPIVSGAVYQVRSAARLAVGRWLRA